MAPPPSYLPEDASAVSLSFLANISNEVYSSEETPAWAAASSPSSSSPEILRVGADHFSIYEHFAEGPSTTTTTTKATLFVAISGTVSPLQHFMNVMPQVFQGLHAVGQAFSTKEDLLSTSDGTTSGDHRASSSAVAAAAAAEPPSTTTEKDAYEVGHLKGWEDPARRIYEEVLRVCSRRRTDDDDSDRLLDPNQMYDRIIFTGHSRGGLLAYYAGMVCSRGTDTIPPYNNKGRLGVVGFGMPPPQRRGNRFEQDFASRNVISVIHRDDPVSNGKILKCEGWNPVTLAVGRTATTMTKQQPSAPKQRPRASAAPNGFWGTLGFIAKAAVSAVGDTAREVASEVEIHHSVSGYLENLISSDPSDDLNASKAASARSIESTDKSKGENELLQPYVVELQKRRRTRTTDGEDYQWVLVFSEVTAAAAAAEEDDGPKDQQQQQQQQSPNWIPIEEG